MAPCQVVGSFRDPEAVKAFAQGVAVLTVEIEHIDADAMEVRPRRRCAAPRWAKLGCAGLVVLGLLETAGGTGLCELRRIR